MMLHSLIFPFAPICFAPFSSILSLLPFSPLISWPLLSSLFFSYSRHLLQYNSVILSLLPFSPLISWPLLRSLFFCYSRHLLQYSSAIIQFCRFVSSRSVHDSPPRQPSKLACLYLRAHTNPSPPHASRQHHTFRTPPAKPPPHAPTMDLAPKG